MAKFKAVVFDLDGVVYRGKSPIPGVPQEIARLQKKIEVLFFTNNATKSRDDYVRHLADFGIRANRAEIMTSSFGCAHYIAEKYGKGRKVFVVGEQGLVSELRDSAGAEIIESVGADVVACGLYRGINYRKLDLAVRNLAAGAKFVLANNDPTYPTENGFSPGSGAIAAAISYASSRKPDVVIGKPSTYLLDKLLEENGLKPNEAAVVGDRLDIDIRMANKAGMASVLVLSGVATESDAKSAQASDRPKFVVKSAAEAGKALGI